eukprot:403354574
MDAFENQVISRNIQQIVNNQRKKRQITIKKPSTSNQAGARQGKKRFQSYDFSNNKFSNTFMNNHQNSFNENGYSSSPKKENSFNFGFNQQMFTFEREKQLQPYMRYQYNEQGELRLNQEIKGGKTVKSLAQSSNYNKTQSNQMKWSFVQTGNRNYVGVDTADTYSIDEVQLSKKQRVLNSLVQYNEQSQEKMTRNINLVKLQNQDLLNKNAQSGSQKSYLNLERKQKTQNLQENQIYPIGNFQETRQSTHRQNKTSKLSEYNDSIFGGSKFGNFQSESTFQNPNKEKGKNLKVSLDLPIARIMPNQYVKIPFLTGQEMQKDLDTIFRAFLLECSAKFNQKKQLEHVFLMDGTPIFSLDEIPQEVFDVQVSHQPVVKHRSHFSKQFEQINQSINMPLPDNIDVISRETQSYMKNREHRQSKQVDQESLQRELSKYGKDLLKDQNFYQDLSEDTQNRLSKVFDNNTYLVDSQITFKKQRSSTTNQNKNRIINILDRQSTDLQNSFQQISPDKMNQSSIETFQQDDQYNFSRKSLKQGSKVSFGIKVKQQLQKSPIAKDQRNRVIHIQEINNAQEEDSNQNKVGLRSQRAVFDRLEQSFQELQIIEEDAKQNNQIQINTLSSKQLSARSRNSTKNLNLQANTNKNFNLTVSNNTTDQVNKKSKDSLNTKSDQSKDSRLSSKNPRQSVMLDKLHILNNQFELAKQIQLNAIQRQKERHEENMASPDHGRVTKDKLKKYANVIQEIFDEQKAKDKIEQNIGKILRHSIIHQIKESSGEKSGMGASLNSILQLKKEIAQDQNKKFRSSLVNGILSRVQNQIEKEEKQIIVEDTESEFSFKKEQANLKRKTLNERELGNHQQAKVKFIDAPLQKHQTFQAEHSNSRMQNIMSQQATSMNKISNQSQVQLSLGARISMAIKYPNQTKSRITRQDVQQYMSQIPQFRRSTILNSHRGTNVNKSQETYLDKNIKQVMKDEKVKNVDDQFTSLVGMNIPKIQLECSFSRKELYNIFTKFKALSKVSMKNFPDIMKEVGVERSVFMNGMKQLSLDNTDFLERIFQSCDKDNNGYLQWEEFFSALKLISSSDVNDKIDLFFKIVDSDGNGMFSFDEIKEICYMSMSKVSVQDEKPGDRQFLDDTAQFYAGYIFKLLGKNLDEEIPIDDFKNAIFYGNQEQKEVLSMFCMADVQLQEMFSEDNKYDNIDLSPNARQSKQRNKNKGSPRFK